jgi:hypothetical protein
MTDQDLPQVTITRTAGGFTISKTALHEALRGGADAVTFIAPDGYVFGDDRRLHADLEVAGGHPDEPAIRAAAEQERQQLIEQENERHASDTVIELRRHRDALAHIESVYRLRLSVLNAEPARETAVKGGNPPVEPGSDWLVLAGQVPFQAGVLYDIARPRDGGHGWATHADVFAVGANTARVNNELAMAGPGKLIYQVHRPRP